MLWEQDEEAPLSEQRPEAVELFFPLRGDRLQGDYRLALATALEPLLSACGADPARVGVRLTHLPASGNGWYRERGAVIHLSRRVSLALRVARDAANGLGGLAGAQICLGDTSLRLGPARVEELPAVEPLYAPYVLGLTETEDEAAFEAALQQRLQVMDIVPRRLLCGRTEPVQTPAGVRLARSVLVDGMGVEAGLRLQARGVGEGRQWGCGLFLPHKAVL